MIKRVLIISLVIFIIALFIFWLVTGGGAAAARAARSLANPLELIFGTSTSGSFIALPWQPDSSTRGPDISDYASEAAALNQASGDTDQLPSSEDTQVRDFGTPSPYAGRITIRESSATESDPSREFIELAASESNTGPILITNWSLQSAVSGARAPIPQAAPAFVMGVVNNVLPISLEPGAAVFVTTAASPVGTSFRENVCTGYLSELQTFTPELAGECPAPSEMLPMNADNIRTYGSSCFDYLNNLSSCHFTPNPPPSLSPACRSFITNAVSYNGCVNTYRAQASFTLPTYRAYLSLRSELWANTHEVVRLLDAEGRTVDVLTY
ncbi:hypothetical protein HY971_02620 [Candidatus Kaiserbacteria bacterium]|nr:hypothetical protein [Candidatus Kaiserbacteria bacterium]